MNILLPVLALALAVVSAFVSPREPVPDRPAWSRSVVALALAGVAIVAAVLLAKGVAVPAIVFGVAGGVVAAQVAAGVGRPVTGVAIGVAAAAALPVVASPADLPQAQFALVASAGIASLAFGTYEAILAAVAASVVAAGSYLGGANLKHEAAPTVALVVGLGAVVGILVGSPLKSAAVRAILPAVGAVVAAGVLGLRVVNESGIAATVAVGAVAGLVVRLLLPDDEEVDGLRVGLAALIWLGVATLAFGLLRGFGMSLALIGGLAALVPTGARRALATLGVLSGLVLYRLLRDAQPEASRALDIGQHYALVGLSLGLILPLLPTEWRSDERREPVGALLWGLLALGVPALSILVFGGVGSVGFIVGLGLAGLVQALRGGNHALVLPLGMGMAGTTVLLTGWLGTVTGLTRDEKLRVLAIGGTALLIVAGLLALLGRRPKTEVAA